MSYCTTSQMLCLAHSTPSITTPTHRVPTHPCKCTRDPPPTQPCSPLLPPTWPCFLFCGILHPMASSCVPASHTTGPLRFCIPKLRRVCLWWTATIWQGVRGFPARTCFNGNDVGGAYSWMEESKNSARALPGSLCFPATVQYHFFPLF